MAEDILSQEEVDALLRGVTAEPDESQAPAEGGGVRRYDIGRQERIVRPRMPALELLNERFARQLRAALARYLQRDVEVAAGPIRVLKYSDFLRNLAAPIQLNLLHLKPLRGSALLVVAPDLVYHTVDALFGGQGRFHSRGEEREFTAAEQRLIQRLLAVALPEYEKAWAALHALKVELVRAETNPRFAAVAEPGEVVLSTGFNVSLASGGGEFHVCIPYAMLESIRDRLYAAGPGDRREADERWLKSMTQQVQDARVELVATLGSPTLSVRQLLTLKAGDVISLDLPESVAAEVEGTPLFQCRYGVINGHYALKVEKLLTPHSAERAPGGVHA